MWTSNPALRPSCHGPAAGRARARRVPARARTRRCEYEHVDPEILVRETWDALSSGDLAAAERVLAPDARWRAVEDGPWNCESRSQIVAVLERGLASGLAGRIEEVVPAGPERAIVAFRPDRSEPGQWPLEDGVRNLVLTFRDGRIVEMKGCATRRAALEYAG